jgi:tyrosinase
VAYQSEVGKVFREKSFNSFAQQLENFHGWFHSLVGGYGDMSGHFWPVEYSAFDPIFMLHHAYVYIQSLASRS